MKNLNIISAAVISVVMLATSAFAQDYQKGLEAAQSGDFATALQEWRPLAEQGHADAQYNLGIMYDNGQGVSQDYVEAAKWWRLAAEQGVAPAQYNLGLMYYFGEGLPQDYAEAERLYRLSAEQGHALAQTNLGWMYGTGEGVQQDNVLAHMWFNLGAANGDELGAKNRDNIAKEMTPQAIEKAQSMVKECMDSGYKGCGLEAEKKPLSSDLTIAEVEQLKRKCDNFTTLKSICWGQTQDERELVLRSLGYTCSNESYPTLLGLVKYRECKTGKIWITLLADEIRFNCHNFNTCDYQFEEVAELLIKNDVISELNYQNYTSHDGARNVLIEEYCGRGTSADELCITNEGGLAALVGSVIVLSVGASREAAPSFN